MHELTLAESMMEIVERAAAQAGAKKVTRVRLAIGALAHVETEALLFCCEVVCRNSVADGAQFEVERPPGRAHCHACGQDSVLDHLSFECPHCAAYGLHFIDGEQMQVMDIGII